MTEKCYFAWNTTLGEYQIIHEGAGECIACRECDKLEIEIENLERENGNGVS